VDTDASTITDLGGDSLAAPATAPGTVAALAVVWSRAPRVGEVFLLAQRGALFIGRGTRLTASDPRHLRPVQQRPGGNVACKPLSSPRLSREQLRLQPLDGSHTVTNHGRLPLSVNGHTVERARLTPGDVLQLGSELVLLYQHRPARLPEGAPLHTFGQPDADGIVGEGPAAWALRRSLRRVAGRAAPVLLLGESGTGKELAAQAVHRLSGRAGVLAARSAATFPEGLVDAELFGNIRDYPNPGMPARPGLVGEAHGGTLFLDELGELPPAMQARLLRLLDDGDYHRLGESAARRADIRFLAATNRAPEVLKRDLLARLSQRILLPGLGERPEDIPLLLAHLLRTAGSAQADRFLRDDGSVRITPALLSALLTHRYTTHVRELRRLLWAAIDGSRGRYLDVHDGVVRDTGSDPPPGTSDPAALTREDVLAALRACGFVQARAWRRLGLSSRHQLGRLIKKLDVPLD